jgi:transposase
MSHREVISAASNRLSDHHLAPADNRHGPTSSASSPTKSAEQLDLQAMHRVRERLVSQRTGIINQIRAFLLERGVAVRQALRFLRTELHIHAAPCDALSPCMLRLIEDLASDWRRLDERIENLSGR